MYFGDLVVVQYHVVDYLDVEVMYVEYVFVGNIGGVGGLFCVVVYL